MNNYYEGNIEPAPDVIFVFGSNPEGRHGAGSAKVAHDVFGAQYGVGEGLTGNSYALPTKDLRVTENHGYRSISPESITESIRKLYETARNMEDKRFMVAYRNKPSEKTLNGYTGLEMMQMFKDAAPIPQNVVFSKEWVDDGFFDDATYEKTYEIEEFCKHERHLYKQGLCWCAIDGGMSNNCKNCTLREPEKKKYRITTATAWQQNK